jgi:hypothetical protein
VRLLNEPGVTILLVEQNVRGGLGAATLAVVMERQGPPLRAPREILDDPEIADLYLGGRSTAPPRHERPAGMSGAIWATVAGIGFGLFQSINPSVAGSGG